MKINHSITKLILLALVFLIAINYTQSSHWTLMDLIADKPVKNQFKVWHHVMDRPYDINTMYAVERFKIFKENYDYIQKINSQNKGFKLGLGPFSDLSNEEYKKTLIGLKDDNDDDDDDIERNKQEKGDNKINNKFLDFDSYVDNNDLKNNHIQSNENIIKTTPDWTNYFPLVENQKSCGSCWAFASVSILEAAVFAQQVEKITDQKVIDKMERIKLSKQQLVDCDERSYGCSGGYTNYSVKYYMTEHPILRDSEYGGYKPYQTKCNENKVKIEGDKDTTRFKVKEHFYVGNYCTKYYSADGTYKLRYDMAEYIKNGPSVISINASSKNFQSYRSGIIDLKEDCINEKNSNHAVVLVQVNNEEGFYKIRNSWGSWWGENGYIRVAIDDCKENLPSSKYNYYQSCFISKKLLQIKSVIEE